MFHLSTIEPETYLTLQSIFAVDLIKEKFALAGGTALALQAGHRKSVDLDIFSPNPIEPYQIEINLRAAMPLKFEFVNSNKNMLFAFINSIKCDFIYEPSKLLHPFLEFEGVNYYHVEDIAAMKLHTICGRGKRKDFFDVYVLTEIFGWNKLMNLFESKYGKDQLYFLLRSIHYFEDAEEDPAVIGLRPYNKSWMEVKEYILKNCN